MRQGACEGVVIFGCRLRIGVACGCLLYLSLSALKEQCTLLEIMRDVLLSITHTHECECKHKVISVYTFRHSCIGLTSTILNQHICGWPGHCSILPCETLLACSKAHSCIQLSQEV